MVLTVDAFLNVITNQYQSILDLVYKLRDQKYAMDKMDALYITLIISSPERGGVITKVIKDDKKYFKLKIWLDKSEYSQAENALLINVEYQKWKTINFN